MKKILNIFTIFTMLIFSANADIVHQQKFPFHSNPKEIAKEHEAFDKLLNERLNFSIEQKKAIRENHENYKNEISKIFSKMEKLQLKIRNVYLSGLPKWQTDLRTAPYKAELVLLKQEAENKRIENRKNFENILTEEQLLEFEKIKKERLHKKPSLN